MDWQSCSEGEVATLACIPLIIKLIVNAALVLAGVSALVLIIISGIKYITSNGDQTKIDSAKKTLTWAIIGLFIILMSFFIIGVISKLTGVTQIANPTL